MIKTQILLWKTIEGNRNKKYEEEMSDEQPLRKQTERVEDILF